MKRYIKTEEMAPMVTLRDLFSEISAICIVDDVRDYIVSDRSVDEVYASYTDNELRALSKLEIQNVFNLKALHRMRDVVSDRMTPYQISAAYLFAEDKHTFTLSDLLSDKNSLSEDDKQYLISRLKRCNRIKYMFKYSSLLSKSAVEPNTEDSLDLKDDEKAKTYNFIVNTGLSKLDILKMIRTLDVSDFDHTTKSYSHKNYINDLYVFLPNFTFDGEQVRMYVKVDYDTTDKNGRTIGLMSFHISDDKKFRLREEMLRNGDDYPRKELHRPE